MWQKPRKGRALFFRKPEKYLTYQDRLTRFGFHYLETIFSAHHVNILVMKDVNHEKTVQEELAEDRMSLITSFSGK